LRDFTPPFDATLLAGCVTALSRWIRFPAIEIDPAGRPYVTRQGLLQRTNGSIRNIFQMRPAALRGGLQSRIVAFHARSCRASTVTQATNIVRLRQVVF
jgi:hypothetical protein